MLLNGQFNPPIVYVLIPSAPSGLVKGLAKAPEILEEDINIMISTNVTALINMTQAVLPIFQRRENGGKGDIINIGSIAGRDSYAGGSIYCASKAAVRSFTDALRKELIATRIRVIEIDPGQVETVCGRITALQSSIAHMPCRSFPSYVSTGINRRQMLSMRTYQSWCLLKRKTYLSTNRDNPVVVNP